MNQRITAVVVAPPRAPASAPISAVNARWGSRYCARTARRSDTRGRILSALCWRPGARRPRISMKKIAITLATALCVGAARAQPPDDALLGAANAEQPALLKTLERLVGIETGTGT